MPQRASFSPSKQGLGGISPIREPAFAIRQGYRFSVAALPSSIRDEPVEPPTLCPRRMTIATFPSPVRGELVEPCAPCPGNKPRTRHSGKARPLRPAQDRLSANGGGLWMRGKRAPPPFVVSLSNHACLAQTTSRVLFAAAKHAPPSTSSAQDRLRANGRG